MTHSYIDNQDYKEALNLINSLLRELKKLDDKMILTEVHLLESRVHHNLVNLPKAKAALTSARTAANSIYCPPTLQAQLDMQSGVLHAEDKDYKTASVRALSSSPSGIGPGLTSCARKYPSYSYFYEAFEGYSSQDDARAVPALKYMLLCKIMLNLVRSALCARPEAFSTSLEQPETDPRCFLATLCLLRTGGRCRVDHWRQGGAAVRGARSRSDEGGREGARGSEPATIRTRVARTQKRCALPLSPPFFPRGLPTSRAMLTNQRWAELSDDPIIRNHLAALYDTLLEQNLMRIIEPYSRVDIAHVAELVKQPVRDVEIK